MPREGIETGWALDLTSASPRRLRSSRSSSSVVGHSAGRGTGHSPWHTGVTLCVIGVECGEGGVMAKRFGRPSLQYRYEHYDPRW